MRTHNRIREKSVKFICNYYKLVTESAEFYRVLAGFTRSLIYKAQPAATMSDLTMIAVSFYPLGAITRAAASSFSAANMFSGRGGGAFLNSRIPPVIKTAPTTE